MKNEIRNDNAAAPVAGATVDSITIGDISDHTRTVTVRYVIGLTREGWYTADAVASAGDISTL